jgi:hypothetical protein
VANYDVDIEVVLRGDRKIKELERNISSLNKQLDNLAAKQKQVNDGNPFSAAGNRKIKAATDGYVEQARVLNTQVQVQRRLSKERAQELKRLADITNQIKQAKRADDERAATALANRQKLQKRGSAAVTAGAFPLLFGGGPFQALGGALGGAATGNMFGGLTVALQVVGGFVDKFAAQAIELGQALRSTTGDFERVAQAAGLAGTSSFSYLQEIKQLGSEQEALRLATESLSTVVGADGVDALRTFGDESVGLANTFGQAMAQMQASLSRLLAPLLRATGAAIQGAVDVGAGQTSTDPELVRIQSEIRRRQATYNRDADLPARDSIENRRAIRELAKERTQRLKEIREEEEKTLRLTKERLTIEQNDAKITTLTTDQLEVQNALLETDLDLLDKTVQKLREREITVNKEVEERKILDALANNEISTSKASAQLEDLKVKTGQKRQRLALDIAAAEEAAAARAEQARNKADRDRQRAAAAFERQEQQLINLQLRGEAQREREVELAGQRIDKYSDQLRLLEAQINGTEDQVRLEIDLANAAGKVERNYVKRIFAAKQTLKQLEEQRRVFEAIGDTIKTGVVDGITAAIDQTRTLGEVASNVLRTIANQLLRLGVNQVFSAFNFGGGGGGGGSTGPNVDLVGQYMGERALGGSVSSGRPYMVGERGPELFVPGAQGNIIPNNAMGSTSVVVNVDASGTEVQGNQGNADQLGRLIGQAVQAELIKQKRPGGLLTR